MPTFATDLLDIAYRDEGPRDGKPVLLLHGWPDDHSTWDGVVPRLQDAGMRTIVPSLRRFGDTRFRDPDAARTGNYAVLALDAIALMAGLGIDRFSVTGHDWGSSIAETLAVGWPDRVERMAQLATPPRLGGLKTPPFWHVQLEWYHWFMATGRGAAAVRADPRGFARTHWDNWSPDGWYDEATFERVAASWDNPDWVDITLHSYRARWDEAPLDPDSVALEARVQGTASLSLPALYIQGEVDGVNPPAASRDVAGKFDGPFRYLLLPGVGHFPQREAPDAVSDALLALLNDTDADRGQRR